ncbi:uncharacterized protein LOC115074105 isoform X1 [Rhinatrema bivittatum]|uniref:uncharacterized protein LOC115074105 isoform X1 n=1 Tax=Rhinatrema bivittatum TaxID=194408 RepID=UPI00112ED5A0|nr:uncharacterized protein LOC115074105 isoform X1 [Rhinatrema bivittatum]XP_029429115.1 uncharacterized protein LOC115074105 isoform X1 [Rhinatrema bivittatum]
MASQRTVRTWTDLQESLNRVRQQLGLVPRAGWDSLITSNVHLCAHSANQRIRQRTHSSPFLPSLADAPRVRREKKSVVHPDSGKDGRKKNWRKRDFVIFENAVGERTGQRGSMHNKVHAAYYYLLENKDFAWNFADAFISEVLADELVPDVLIETLTHCFAKSRQMYPQKSHDKRQIKNRLLGFQAVGYSLSPEQFLSSLLEELVLEVLRELSVNVLRNTMKELVDDHLTRSAMHDVMDEIVTEAVQSQLSVAIQDSQNELEWEETLGTVISGAIEGEVRGIVLSVLSEHDTELLKLQHNQIAASARKQLIDSLLLEHLIGMHGPALPWKDEASRCLDSWMLDILLRQYMHMHEQQQDTVGSLLLADFHRRAFQEVALDVILTELSKTLEEDMEDLLENEIQLEIGEFPTD